jgi:hypothetical protein
VPAVRRPVAHAADHAVFLDEVFDVGPHVEPERGIFLGLLREEGQKTRLRHPHDVREARLHQAAKIERHDRAGRGGERRAVHLDVRQFVQGVGQADLVEDFQGGGVEGVAAEVAVKGRVRFEQGHRDAAAGQQQGQH